MPANRTSPAPPAPASGGRIFARPPAAVQHPVAGSLPHWRALLEARWQAQLERLTELSLAYHDAAAAAGGGAGAGGIAGGAQYPLRQLMRRAVAARRGLANVEEALAKLAAGRFGRCEQCASAIPVATLESTPEARYCHGCAPGLPAGGGYPAQLSL